MTTPTHFQQQLAEELTARAAALPPMAAAPTRPRHTRRIAVTALGLAAAATAAIVIPQQSHTAAPQAGAGQSVAHQPTGTAVVLSNASYTVAPQKDGTVSIQVMGAQLSGLQAALRSLGVPAVVLKLSASCPAKVDTDDGAAIDSVQSFDPKNGRVMVIRPSAIPHGESLVLVDVAPKGVLHPSAAGDLNVLLAHGEPNCFPASQATIIGEG